MGGKSRRVCKFKFVEMQNLKYLLLSYLLFQTSLAFSFPGLVPKSYRKGQDMRISASLISSDTVRMPYDFYDKGMCKPVDFSTINYESVTWGEALAEEHWVNSPYSVKLDEDLEP